MGATLVLDLKEKKKKKTACGWIIEGGEGIAAAANTLCTQSLGFPGAPATHASLFWGHVGGHLFTTWNKPFHHEIVVSFFALICLDHNPFSLNCFALSAGGESHGDLVVVAQELLSPPTSKV